MCCFFFHYVSAKFHLWPSSGDLPRPRIGMLSLVTVSLVVSAFHSKPLAGLGRIWNRYLLTMLTWNRRDSTPSKPLAGLGRIWNRYLLTMLTWNRRDSTPLSAAQRAPKGDQEWIFWSYKSLSGLRESGPYRIFVLVFNWNHFEMRFLNLRINFYLLRTFFLHVGSFCVVSSFTTFRPNFGKIKHYLNVKAQYK